MRYPQQPLQDPMEPVQRYPMPGQQPMPQQPYPQGGQAMNQQYSQPLQQPCPQGAQPVEQQYSQPMQQPYPQGAQPLEQQYSQPMQPVQQPAPGGVAPAAPDGRGRHAAGLFIRDTWVMLAALVAVLLVIFVMVRLATRGYLWGLIFVLMAAVAAEFPALKVWISSLADLSGGQVQVQTGALAGIAEVAPGLMSRLGLSTRARYCLTDDQGRSYYFTAEKGLAASFGEVEGAEAELACLPHSRLLTGLNPIRRTEQLSVMDSARERHLRQIFRDYLI